MDKITILKLGGSAITDKSRKCTPDIPTIQHVADQLADYRLPLILVHGGGSYAHPFVVESGLNRGLRNRTQAPSISETEFYLSQLTRIVCSSLLLRNMLPVPLHPMSFATLRAGKVHKFFMDPIRWCLQARLIPVLHGDLVFDESDGVRVLSGDHIASLLGPKLGASRVLLGCDVDGVYWEDPKNSSDASLISEVTPENFRRVLHAARMSSEDASGGMAEKVRQALHLARSGCECYIFNLRKRDALRELLDRSECIGTKFVSWTKSRKSLKRLRQKE
jgi:isopentenyl phosphate kinase